MLWLTFGFQVADKWLTFFIYDIKYIISLFIIQYITSNKNNIIKLLQIKMEKSNTRIMTFILV
jgi:hypothetical protein